MPVYVRRVRAFLFWRKLELLQHANAPPAQGQWSMQLGPEARLHTLIGGGR